MPRKIDYTKYSKEEIIAEIIELKKRKKYGLVWDEDREPEDVVLRCKKEMPVLNDVIEKEIKNDPEKPFHILIEGDNYHALSVLNYTHKNAIDVIYIDPPYNTGAKDWKYNNNYVDNNDTWRHSKWISMMKNRLELVKKLLKEDGVIIITIDDNEACSLGLLLEDIFPSKERSTVVIKYNPAGTARNGFSRNHEYAYFLLNPGQEIEKRPAPRDVRDQNLRRHGNGANRQDSPTMFFPIKVDKKRLTIVGVGDVPPADFHPKAQTIEYTDYYEIWPIDNREKEKRWYFGKERVESKGPDELKCKWVKGRLHVYFHTDNLSEQKYQSVWIGSEYDSGAYGGSLVRDIVGKKFPFPKSIHAVKDCLNAIVRNKKNAIVLDFFAGSGTTGHAVLELNKEDGGKRKFILCTNNENNSENDSGGVAEEFCYPRIKKVIEGYKNLDNEYIYGLGGNLKYYKTDFVSFAFTDSDKRALTNKSTELLCMAEETYNEILFKQGEFSLFENESKITAIIYDEDSIDSCKAEIKKYHKAITIYVFSYDKEYNPEDFSDLKGRIKIKPIPEAILNIYRRIIRK